MRVLPPAFATALSGDVATLCTAWLIVRADAARFGFTDHDRALTIGEDLFMPALAAGDSRAACGLAIDSTGIEGAFAHDAVTPEDLAEGLWDAARIYVWRVDWTAPANRVCLFSGAFGAVQAGSEGFSVTVEGAGRALARAFGRTYQRACDADLGDARCGIDLARAAFSATSVVLASDGARVARVAGLGAFEDGWFAAGSIAWEHGRRAAIVRHWRDGGEALLELDRAPPPAGVTALVRAGCDKAFATCRAKFANSANFRGFPHMIGADGMIRGPVAGEAADGSARG